MNALNSLIFEGEISEKGTLNEYQGEFGTVAYCTFKVTNTRKYVVCGVEKIEKHTMPVKVYGRTAEYSIPRATVGREVRIVGRLSAIYPDDIYIVAEHIEFKPLKDGKTE